MAFGQRWRVEFIDQALDDFLRHACLAARILIQNRFKIGFDVNDTNLGVVLRPDVDPQVANLASRIGGGNSWGQPQS